MKCDKCNQPATVHETIVQNGVKREIHLCTSHAEEAGLVMHQIGQPVDSVLKQFVISHAGSSRAREEGTSCPGCKMTWARFKKTGTLGCAQCYQTFERALGPLVERAQNGATHHIGKTPRSSRAVLDRKLEIRRLTQELEKAVAAERYERAAEIRDRLNTIEPLTDDEDNLESNAS